MGRILLGLAGLGLLVLVFYDLLVTILLLRGGGPLTLRLTHGIWGLLLRVHRRRAIHRVLSAGGVLILLVTFSTWIVLFWIGWALIFNMAEPSVQNAQTGVPADFVSRLYYTGFTFITLGIGDYKPAPGLWQILTVVLAGTGFFLVTLIITYLLPVVSALVEKHQTAGYLACLSRHLAQRRPRELEAALSSHLVSLTPKICRITEQHLAYPVLHFFHNPNPALAFTLRLAAFDELLTWAAGQAERAEEQGAVGPLRQSITLFLDTLDAILISPVPQAPPVPDLSLLLDGSTTLDSEAVRQAYAGEERRRRLLASLVRHNGWNWDDLPRILTGENK